MENKMVLVKDVEVSLNTRETSINLDIFILWVSGTFGWGFIEKECKEIPKAPWYWCMRKGRRDRSKEFEKLLENFSVCREYRRNGCEADTCYWRMLKMYKDRLTFISKKILYALRHHPEEYGLPQMASGFIMLLTEHILQIQSHRSILLK